MSLRLQKFLAQAGVASRRRAEQLIAQGHVQVNHQTVTEQGIQVDPKVDRVSVDGRRISLPAKFGYWLLYKPAGMLTTLKDPEGRPTVADLLTENPRRLFPVGRLDFDAEGALLLTDDGELAHRLMHPKFQVRRTYLAKVRGVPGSAELAKLQSGVRLEDGIARALEAEIFEQTEKNTWLRMVVTEGRNHLIKRLCAAVGHPVVRLYRPFVAGVGVQKMKPGQLRELSSEEISKIQLAAQGEAFDEPALGLPPRRHAPPANQFKSRAGR